MALAVAAAAALIAGALGGWTARSQAQDALSATRSRLQDAADARARAVDADWAENARALGFLAADPSFLHDARLAARGDAAARRRAESSMDLLRRRRRLLEIDLGAPGKPTLSAVGAPAAGASSAEETLEVPAPDFAKGGVLRARVCVACLAAHALPPEPANGGLSTALLRRDGDDLVSLTPLRGLAAMARLPMSTPNLVGAAALRGERGLLSGVDYRGAPAFAAARRAHGRDWVVVAKTDAAPILARLRRREALLVLGLAALGFASGMALILLLRGEAADARRALNRRRALLLRAVEQSSETIIITDADARIEYVNPAFTRATGYSRAEVLGQKPSLLKSGRQDKAFYEELWATLTRGEPWHGRFANRRKDGTLYEEDATIAPVRRAGRVVHYIAVKRDISRERQLTEQFHRAQKMEPLGLLAAGVAHDINNLLTAIIGYGEMIAAAAPGTQAAGDAGEILRACERAAALTRQLLAFGRRGAGKPEVLDLNAAAAGMQKLLRRVLRENIDLRVEPSAEPAWALIEPTALDQAILNLAVNARDAMPEGGTLTLSVAAVAVEPGRSAPHADIPPGLYARLSVVDTGVGMTAEVRAKIFEPFFTTKPEGRGTGLGLAVVRAVAQDAGGAIGVDSEPGRGCAFHLYLPLAAAPEAAGRTRVPAAPKRGSGTVLLVEDEEDLRRMLERVLKAQGYAVLACRDAEQAAQVEAAHRGNIRAALCDVGLPGLDGRRFAAGLRERRPETKILLMSGHAEARPGEQLLAKPFALAEMLRRVGET